MYDGDFGAFYRKYAPLVRRTLARRGVRPDDLDDISHEAFMTIRRLLSEFEGKSSFETWVQSVTSRIASGYHKRAFRRYEVANADAASMVPCGAEDAEPAAPVLDVLGALEHDLRDVLALHFVGGFSISDLSEITGRTRTTVRERVARARGVLERKILAKASVDPGWIDQLAPGLAARIEQRQPPVPSYVMADGSVFSRIDDIVIALWRVETSVKALEALLMFMFGILDEHPGGIRLLNVVEPTSQIPCREARDLHVWGVRQLDGRLRAAAWSVEDRGMMSLVPPVVNAALFLSGARLNARFFDNVTEAVTWLSAHGTRCESTQVIAHVEWMRSRVAG